MHTAHTHIQYWLIMSTISQVWPKARSQQYTHLTLLTFSPLKSSWMQWTFSNVAILVFSPDPETFLSYAVRPILGRGNAFSHLEFLCSHTQFSQGGRDNNNQGTPTRKRSQFLKYMCLGKFPDRVDFSKSSKRPALVDQQNFFKKIKKLTRQKPDSWQYCYMC